MQKIQSFLQDTEVSIVLGKNNSVSSAERHGVPVPEKLACGMVVAVEPSKNDLQQYWLATIVSEKSDNPLTYNIRYYQQKKSTTRWTLMRGNGAYGYVPHGGIIAAGLELDNNGTMRKSSLRMIEKQLSLKKQLLR